MSLPTLLLSFPSPIPHPANSHQPARLFIFTSSLCIGAPTYFGPLSNHYPQMESFFICGNTQAEDFQKNVVPIRFRL